MSNEQEFIVVTPAMLRRVAELERWQQRAVYYLKDSLPDYKDIAKRGPRFKEQLDELKALIEEANGGMK